MALPILNLCLDLNIWCAAFLADRKGAKDTACQTLVGMVRTGQVADFPLQLVVSWGMLTRLRKVFEVDWGVPRPTVDLLVETIASYARLGPAGTSPHLTLGGTGLMPMRDEEDAHVVDTAMAGGAHLLVTANFDDFLGLKGRVLESGRVAMVETAKARLIVAHPFRAVEWLRSGRLPAL